MDENENDDIQECPAILTTSLGNTLQ